MDVRLIVDAKENEHTDKKGKKHASFPARDNLADDQGGEDCPPRRLSARGAGERHRTQQVHGAAEGRRADARRGLDRLDQHLRRRHPRPDQCRPLGPRTERWPEPSRTTGSCCSDDPGAREGEDASTARRATTPTSGRRWRSWQRRPLRWPTSRGASRRSSARAAAARCSTCTRAGRRAARSSCITLAFGINKSFKDALQDNTGTSQIGFLLLEKQDKPTPTNQASVRRLNARNNIYSGLGSYRRTPLYQWARETNTRSCGSIRT